MTRKDSVCIYGDDCREEMLSKPTGSYTQNNLSYARNFIYPDDREIFNKFTSLEWYRNNLSSAAGTVPDKTAEAGSAK